MADEQKAVEGQLQLSDINQDVTEPQKQTINKFKLLFDSLREMF